MRSLIFSGYASAQAAVGKWGELLSDVPAAGCDTRPLASSRRDYPDQRAQLQTPTNRQAATKQKVNRTTTLKTSKTESKPVKGCQPFWFLLCNGNRVDRLAASHEHYAPPVQVRIRHKRCPLRATPIYSVSTLSWLRSALKRLPSFALEFLFARDLALRPQTQPPATTPQSTANPSKSDSLPLDLPRNP
jgi:hypothetical protein